MSADVLGLNIGNKTNTTAIGEVVATSCQSVLNNASQRISTATNAVSSNIVSAMIHIGSIKCAGNLKVTSGLYAELQSSYYADLTTTNSANFTSNLASTLLQNAKAKAAQLQKAGISVGDKSIGNSTTTTGFNYESTANTNRVVNIISSSVNTFFNENDRLMATGDITILSAEAGGDCDIESNPTAVLSRQITSLTSAVQTAITNTTETGNSNQKGGAGAQTGGLSGDGSGGGIAGPIIAVAVLLAVLIGGAFAIRLFWNSRRSSGGAGAAKQQQQRTRPGGDTVHQQDDARGGGNEMKAQQQPPQSRPGGDPAAAAAAAGGGEPPPSQRPAVANGRRRPPGGSGAFGGDVEMTTDRRS